MGAIDKKLRDEFYAWTYQELLNHELEGSGYELRSVMEDILTLSQEERVKYKALLKNIRKVTRNAEKINFDRKIINSLDCICSGTTAPMSLETRDVICRQVKYMRQLLEEGETKDYLMQLNRKGKYYDNPNKNNI